MSLPDTIAAYTDCLDHFDRAASSPRGIRIYMESEKSAIYLRNRLHQARSLDRRESRRTYPKDHPAHGKSLYDGLVVRLLPPADGESGYWVYIEPWATTVGEIEEL